jgi:nucleoside-diphosphate-sugar epimerase
MSSFTDGAGSSAACPVLVTGGAGYLGCVLVPKLLARGHRVTVLDLMLYGSAGLQRHPNLRLLQADIRDRAEVNRAMRGQQAVIHLAGIANEHCFDECPQLARSINHDSFAGLVLAARHAGVERFLFASDCSVYGTNEEGELTEASRTVPVSAYGKYKGLCESLLLEHQAPQFTTTIVRAGTLCGPSPRMRFDLVVNTFVNQAVNKGKLLVPGGSQQRPGIHVAELAGLFALLVDAASDKIEGETFNAVGHNHTILELARCVRSVIEAELPDKKPIEIATTPVTDPRSCRVSAQKLANRLGFEAKRTVTDAVRELCRVFKAGEYADSLSSEQYYNAASLKAKRAA